jgi:two-component system KDP operon response regulator KdpE
VACFPETDVSNQPIVLVVDDEFAIRRLLRVALEPASYRVLDARSSAEAMATIAAGDPTVILLDLGLPDRDGLELIPLLRERSRAAILIISGRDTTEEKVSALDLGASDYVTKPFDTDELLARVRAAIRRRRKNYNGEAVSSFGDLAIDLQGHIVWKRGKEVYLTPNEFAAIVELTRFPGRVIVQQHLLRTIWANDYDRHVEYLRVLIRNLRHKIEDDPSRPALLINEFGIGYRLISSSS